MGGTAGGEHLLVEACEYHSNFLNLQPRTAVILGIEPDHFDCFDSPETLERAFTQFSLSLPENGLIIARHDCPTTQRVVAKAACRVETFDLAGNGLAGNGVAPIALLSVCRQAQEASGRCLLRPRHPDGQAIGATQPPDWRAAGLRERLGRYSFEVLRHGRPFCRVRLRVPGRHNVLNALAATALCHSRGVGPGEIARALGRFAGLQRRLETVGIWRGVTLVDDYAHHPTEVTRRLGGGQADVSRPAVVVRVSTSSGLADRATPGRTGRQPAKCRQAAGGRHLPRAGADPLAG